MKIQPARGVPFGSLDNGDVFLWSGEEILLCMKTLNGAAVVLTDGDTFTLRDEDVVISQPDAKVSL